MKLMVCMTGEPEELLALPEIADMGAGIELGSLGMVGVRSEREWAERCAMHQNVRARFSGPLAVHGPFIGMIYGHIDCLIRQAVHRRLDMTLRAVESLGAERVVLHSGYGPEVDLFKSQEDWLARNVSFWQAEIRRWADAGIQVVLENDLEPIPDMMTRLVNAVDNPALGLCFDIGHQNMFSELSAPQWVRSMGPRLWHVHLHDNDRTGDHHWPLGRGTIDFELFYEVLGQQAPEATISLEVVDRVDVRMKNLRSLAARFGR